MAKYSNPWYLQHHCCAFDCYPQGVRKPAREAYERAMAHLAPRVPASQLLFIDDREVNIKGAQEAGLPALLFKGAEQLEADLKAAGLEF